MSSWLKKLITVGISGPEKPQAPKPKEQTTSEKAYATRIRYCEKCGKELHYKETTKFSKWTGLEEAYQWFLDCPEEPRGQEGFNSVSHDHWQYLSGAGWLQLDNELFNHPRLGTQNLYSTTSRLR